MGDRGRHSDVHIVNLKGKGPTAARFLPEERHGMRAQTAKRMLRMSPSRTS